MVWVAGSLLVGLLAGCASQAGVQDAPDRDAESQITIVIAEDPPSFNAAVADTGHDALVMELVMLGLTDVDPQGNVFPELAAELPSLENGGVVIDEDAGTMEVAWKLRQDVSWSDGEPLNADDVLFTYNAIIDPERGFWVLGIDYVDSVEKIDNYTVLVRYNTIYPGYLTQFGGEQLVIWPEHYCDAEQGFTAWDCGLSPLSSGPYVLEEWVNGDHLTFVRNPDYYQTGKPEIDKIFVRIVPEPSVRKTMLVQGDADLDMWTTEILIEQLKDEPNVRVSRSPTDRWVMRLYMNLAAKGATDPVESPHPILSDVRVRQAIRMAIDVDTISQEVFLGYSNPVWTEFFRPPYACDISKPKYDPQAASALLEEAGWMDTDGDGVRECRGCLNAAEGYPMRMELMIYAEYGEALELSQQLIAEQLGQIGIQLDLSMVEGAVMWADSASGGLEQTGNFDIDFWDDGYSGVDPTDFLWGYYHSAAAEPDAGWNISRWYNEEVDALIDEAYTLDEQRRQEIFCQIAEILDQELPMIPLFSTVNAEAHSARLQGVQSTINDLVTWNAADWTLAEDGE
jgi:peptide/nickel transport system substrate-binding protein